MFYNKYGYIDPTDTNKKNTNIGIDNEKYLKNTKDSVEREIKEILVNDNKINNPITHKLTSEVDEATIYTEKAERNNVLKLTQELLDNINENFKKNLTIDDFINKANEISKQSTNLLDGTVDTDTFRKLSLQFIKEDLFSPIKQATTTDVNVMFDEKNLLYKQNSVVEQRDSTLLEKPVNNNFRETLKMDNPVTSDIKSNTSIEDLSNNINKEPLSTDITETNYVKNEIVENLPQNIDSKNNIDVDISQTEKVKKDSEEKTLGETVNSKENIELDVTKNVKNKSDKNLEKDIVTEDNRVNINTEVTSIPNGKVNSPDLDNSIMLYNNLPIYGGEILKQMVGLAGSFSNLLNPVTNWNPFTVSDSLSRIVSHDYTLSPKEIVKLATMTPKLVPLLKGVDIKVPNFTGILPPNETLLKNDADLEGSFKWYRERVKYQRRKFAEYPEGGCGYILVKSPTSLSENFKIPFQDMPTISEQTVTTEYQKDTILNRIGSIATFSGVGDMNVTLTTKFFAMSPSKKDMGLEGEPFYKKQKFSLLRTVNNILNAPVVAASLVDNFFQSVFGTISDNTLSEGVLGGEQDLYNYWNQSRVNEVMNNLRALQLPSYTSQFFNPPPVISIDFGPESNILKKPVISGLESYPIRNVPRTFIVTSVGINQDMSVTPLRLEMNVDVMVSNLIDRSAKFAAFSNTQRDKLRKALSTFANAQRSISSLGFTATIQLQEVMFNIHELPPSFEEYWGYSDTDKINYSNNVDFRNSYSKRRKDIVKESFALNDGKMKTSIVGDRKKIKDISNEIRKLQSELFSKYDSKIIKGRTSLVRDFEKSINVIIKDSLFIKYNDIFKISIPSYWNSNIISKLLLMSDSKERLNNYIEKDDIDLQIYNYLIYFQELYNNFGSLTTDTILTYVTPAVTQSEIMQIYANISKEYFNWVDSSSQNTIQEDAKFNRESFILSDKEYEGRDKKISEINEKTEEIGKLTEGVSKMTPNIKWPF